MLNNLMLSEAIERQNISCDNDNELIRGAILKARKIDKRNKNIKTVLCSLVFVMMFVTAIYGKEILKSLRSIIEQYGKQTFSESEYESKIININKSYELGGQKFTILDVYDDHGDYFIYCITEMLDDTKDNDDAIKIVTRSFSPLDGEYYLGSPNSINRCIIDGKICNIYHIPLIGDEMDKEVDIKLCGLNNEELDIKLPRVNHKVITKELNGIAFVKNPKTDIEKSFVVSRVDVTDKNVFVKIESEYLKGYEGERCEKALDIVCDNANKKLFKDIKLVYKDGKEVTVKEDFDNFDEVYIKYLSNHDEKIMHIKDFENNFFVNNIRYVELSYGNDCGITRREYTSKEKIDLEKLEYIIIGEDKISIK